MATTPRPAVIGDNELITTDRLEATHFPLQRKLAEFEAKIERLPKRIETDEQAAPIISLIGNARTLGEEIEATRAGVKKPFADAVETVDGFFFAMHAPRKGATPGRLQHAQRRAETLLGEHMQRKEAAEQARIAREREAAEQAAAEARRKAEREQERQRQAEAEERTRAAANAGQRQAAAEAEARIAEDRAFELAQQAAAGPREHTRTRADSGETANLEVEWTAEVPDISKLAGRELWPYVTDTAKKAALAAYVKRNAPKTIKAGETWQPIAGAVMTARRKVQVRR